MTFTWVDAIIIACAVALFWAAGRAARTRPLLDVWLQGGLCVFLATGAVLNAVAGNWGWAVFDGTAAVATAWLWGQARKRRATAKNGARS